MDMKGWFEFNLCEWVPFTAITANYCGTRFADLHWEKNWRDIVWKYNDKNEFLFPIFLLYKMYEIFITCRIL